MEENLRLSISHDSAGNGVDGDGNDDAMYHTNRKQYVLALS